MRSVKKLVQMWPAVAAWRLLPLAKRGKVEGNSLAHPTRPIQAQFRKFRGPDTLVWRQTRVSGLLLRCYFFFSRSQTMSVCSEPFFELNSVGRSFPAVA